MQMFAAAYSRSLVHNTCWEDSAPRVPWYLFSGRKPAAPGGP